MLPDACPNLGSDVTLDNLEAVDIAKLRVCRGVGNQAPAVFSWSAVNLLLCGISLARQPVHGLSDILPGDDEWGTVNEQMLHQDVQVALLHLLAENDVTAARLLPVLSPVDNDLLAVPGGQDV